MSLACHDSVQVRSEQRLHAVVSMRNSIRGAVSPFLLRLRLVHIIWQIKAPSLDSVTLSLSLGVHTLFAYLNIHAMFN
jgi:hypothetical protein